MKKRLLTTSAVDHVDNQKVNVEVEGARFELLYFTNNYEFMIYVDRFDSGVAQR